MIPMTLRWDDGKMNAVTGVYRGMDRFEARRKIVEDLKALGLMERVTDHTSAIGLCERSKTIVEPRASTQWFCRMKPMAEPAIAAVERGEILIVPENRREEYFNWMRNIRDWTLSRQLWWGHRIPAWYCKENRHVTVVREAPAKCATCGSTSLEQDPDVLDTWFSSGLWPFSTLGWPADTPDYKTYYPTSLLITGYDILFFWVARMIMMGMHFTGKIPFRAVYLHSLVRTGSGEEMYKFKGTGLDPVALNRQYGTDAMRFCLASMAAPGTDIVLSDDKLGSARNFANKIWNAARFLFLNLDKFEQTGAKLEELAGQEVRAKSPYRAGGKIALADAWLLARLAATIETVNDALAGYRFHEAAQGVYQFFWGDFCDWYIEWVKPELLGEDRERATASWKNLFAAFDAALRLLHPFMPFLTEELWHQLPQPSGTKSIALGRFPEAETRWKNAEAMREVAQVQEVVTALRAIRAELRLDAKKKVAAEFSTNSPAMGDLIRANREAVERFARLSELRMVPKEGFDTKSGALRSTALFDVRVVYSEAVDSGAERARLKKEIAGLQNAICAKEKQLADQTFRSRAPEKIIRGLEATLAQQKVELEKLQKRLRDLEGGS